MGKMPTIAAFGYRHSRGLPYIYPEDGLGYVGNFLNMLFGTSDQPYAPRPVLERALDVLFILHAEHGQNCSTTAMRTAGSSQTDPYSALAGAAAALSGPLHGGASEPVIEMLIEIGSVDNVPAYLNRVKASEAPLPGFGHRLYRSPDPRVGIIKEIAEEVFNATQRNPLMDVALEMERIAGEDSFFNEQRLYPNTEFFSGVVYQALGLPVDMMSVMFAIPRAAGWLANWKEMLRDEDQRLYRPTHLYSGPESRNYIPIEQRV